MRKTVISAALAASLLLPTAAAFADRITYVVEPGDFLGAIAEEYGVSLSDLRDWNDLDSDMIMVGQELVIHADGPRQTPWTTYAVMSGDTVSGIAASHDCTIDELLAWNPGLNPDRIQIGQELRLRRRGRQQRRVVYEVQAGDFLGRIAERNGVSIDDILSWNRGLDPDRIQIGDELVMLLEGPEEESESVGRPNDGRLVNGEQLPEHRAFQIRDLDIAWGTNETIGFILDGFDHVHGRHPDAPRVRVHDLSDEDGGRLSGHRSHQSGRDADIGFWQLECDDVCEYRDIDEDEIDPEVNWTLLEYWIDHGMVEYVFIDYTLQEPLYEHAREQGASESQLREWFQYPNGRRTARGVIRHEPNHADHMHVRFSCGRDDDDCR